MSIAHAIRIIPPYHGGGRREITQQPKVYAFDTGMVCHFRGWDKIRETDRGPLWEHLVLDTLGAERARPLYFWRDKSGREVDFVHPELRDQVTAFECKIDPDAFEADNLNTFRKFYPKGENYLVSPRVKEPYTLRKKGHRIRFTNLIHLIDGSIVHSE